MTTETLDNAGQLEGLADLNVDTINTTQQDIKDSQLDAIGITGTPEDADPDSALSGFDPDVTLAPVNEAQGLATEQLIDINAIRDVADLSQANLQDLQPLLEEEALRRETAETRADDLFTQIQGLIGDQAGGIGQVGQITPEQKEAIAQIAEQQIASGSEDINTQLQRSLETLREEAGASRGLRFTDTPIFDVGQDVTASANQDIARLISGARGQQAQTELALPFQAAQAELAAVSQLGNLTTGQQAFQEQLAQQAALNRAQLFGQASDLGLNVAGSTIGFGETAIQQAINKAQLDAVKAGQPSTGDRLLQGGLGLGAAALLSDEAVKHDVTPYDESNVLEKLAELNINTWRYNEDQGLGTDKHLGPMAQEFKRVFGVGDGKTIAMVDVVGVMLASQKALAKEALNG